MLSKKIPPGALSPRGRTPSKLKCWLAGGGDVARQYWWRVTEITLDHLRPSPEWKKEMEELALAKSGEAATRRGLKALAELQKQDDDKHRMLRESLEDLAARDLCPF